MAIIRVMMYVHIDATGVLSQKIIPNRGADKVINCSRSDSKGVLSILNTDNNGKFPNIRDGLHSFG